jgi:hypothetical protein
VTITYFFGNFFIELEAFSQALARASSLSYTAGVADLDGKCFDIIRPFSDLQDCESYPTHAM